MKVKVNTGKINKHGRPIMETREVLPSEPMKAMEGFWVQDGTGIVFEDISQAHGYIRWVPKRNRRHDD